MARAAPADQHKPGFGDGGSKLPHFRRPVLPFVVDAITI